MCLRLSHAPLVLEHQHLVAREGRPEAKQLVGIDAAIEGSVRRRPWRGTDGEAILRERAPGTEAFYGVAQQDQ